MAFENVSSANMRRGLDKARAAFLANPLKRTSNFPINFAYWFQASTPIRYCRDDAVGGGDGTTNVAGGGTGAWTFTEATAAVLTAGTMPANGRLVFTGTNFVNTNITIEKNDILLDCRDCVFSGGARQTGALPGAVAGEYYFTLSSNDSWFQFTEDQVRFNAYNGNSTNGRITYSSVAAEVLTVTGVNNQPVEGDIWGVATSSIPGLSTGTVYYCSNPSVNTTGTVTMRLGTSRTGSPGAWTTTGLVTGLTAPGASKYLWTLYSDGYTRRYDDIPAPGLLKAPGDAAFAPWENRMYFKPYGGDSPSSHTYDLKIGSGSANNFTITGANTHVLGGTMYCAISTVLYHTGATATGSGYWGCIAKAGEGGCLAKQPTKSYMVHLDVSDLAGHALGSIGATDSEVAHYIQYCRASNFGRLPMDVGDLQGLVTNLGSDACLWADVLLEQAGHPRNSWVPTLAGTNINYAALVFDRSSKKKIRNIFISDFYGDMINIGSISVGPASLDNRMSNIIIDQRMMSASQVDPCVCFSVNVSGATANAVTGSFAENCLILLGPNMNQSATSAPYQSGVIAIRNYSSANPPINFTMRNSVIYGGSGTGQTVLFTTKRTGVLTMPPIDINGNVYCCPNMSLLYRELDSSSVAFSVPCTQAGITTLAASRTTLAGTPLDVNSLAVDEATMNTYYDSYGKPSSLVAGRGVQVEWAVDWEGKFFKNPPTAGPLEYKA
jgi:hypothetical protein